MSNYKGCCGEDYPQHEEQSRDERCRPPHPPYPPHPKDFPVTILSCGNGAGASLPTNNLALNGGAAQAVIGSNGSACQTVGTVTLDTHELEHPEVKIDFSSLINFRANFLSGYTLRLVFQLSRSCDHGGKTTLATWTYEKEADVYLNGLSIPSEVEVEFEFKDPFGFVWCLCNDCPGCCLYTVEVVDIYAYGIEGLSITNVGLTAIASGKPR